MCGSFARDKPLVDREDVAVLPQRLSDNDVDLRVHGAGITCFKGEPTQTSCVGYYGVCLCRSRVLSGKQLKLLVSILMFLLAFKRVYNYVRQSGKATA